MFDLRSFALLFGAYHHELPEISPNDRAMVQRAHNTATAAEFNRKNRENDGPFTPSSFVDDRFKKAFNRLDLLMSIEEDEEERGLIR